MPEDPFRKQSLVLGKKLSDNGGERGLNFNTAISEGGVVETIVPMEAIERKIYLIRV